jgi:hypothetical protein
VGSIPIHPRHFSPVFAAMTATVTAKTRNGLLNRLRFISLARPLSVGLVSMGMLAIAAW